MADKPKLTRAERKQIEAVIRKYRGDGKPHTAQDTIPYQIMYPDGICYLGNRHYSQSIEFFDINYLLAQPDDQTAIFAVLAALAYSRFRRCFWKKRLSGLPESISGLSCSAFW